MPSEAVEYPVSLRWTIKESDLKSDDSIQSKFIQTSFGFAYFLDILPNSEGYTKIGLHISHDRNLSISCQFVVDINSSKWIWEEYLYTDGEYPSNEIFNCPRTTFFSSSEKYIVDGKFEFAMKGTFYVKEGYYSSNRRDNTHDINGYCPPTSFRHPFRRGEERDFGNLFVLQQKGLHTNWTTKKLGLVLWENEDKDFTIFADDIPISVHKHILALYSPVFAGMFKSGMKEAISNSMDIPNYPFEVVEIIVKLCYDVTVPGNEIMEYKEKLFEFIDQYQMDKIKNDVEDFLIKKINFVNVCSLANCALVAKAAKLEDACYRLLMKCLKEGIAATDFDILDKDFKLKIFENAFVTFV